jgi:HSP20 family molecular chaperone IbpA
MAVMHTDEYVVHFDVPPIADQALEVEVAGNVVTVRFELPDDVDAAHVRATHSHGAIELHAPRKHRRFAVNADASGV